MASLVTLRKSLGDPTATIRACWLSLPRPEALERITDACLELIENETGIYLTGPRRGVVRTALETALCWALRGGVGPQEFIQEAREMAHQRIAHD